MQRDIIPVPAFATQEGKEDGAAVMSFGIAMLKVLEEMLPASADAVEKECRELEESFRLLTHSIDEPAASGSDVKQAMNRIVYGMQFQDRNTQIMEDAVLILRHYRVMLETLHCTLGFGFGAGTCPVAMKAAEEMLSCLRLSSTRAHVAKALGISKCMAFPEGISADVWSKRGNDAELF